MEEIAMTSAELITVSIDIGQRLLESGAEIYRVEESICRICKAYGAHDANVYAVPTGIVATVERENEPPLTRVIRIYNRGTDLNRLDRLNALSRRICEQPMPYQQVCDCLAEIDQIKTYSRSALCLASGGGACFFTLLFGGGVAEGLCALLIGTIVWWITDTMNRIASNALFVNVVGGVWIAAAALGFSSLGLIGSYDTLIIGSIMLLVPGLPITNSIRDLIAGDFMAGITKFTEALLVAAGIAVGVALPLSVAGLLGSVL